MHQKISGRAPVFPLIFHLIKERCLPLTPAIPNGEPCQLNNQSSFRVFRGQKPFPLDEILKYANIQIPIDLNKMK